MRYDYHHLVTFDETNVVGNVYFAHYLHWQGRCRERFLIDFAPGVMVEVMSGDLALVTLDCSMQYHSQSFVTDEIVIGMGLEALHSSRIGMSFVFEKDGRTIATGKQSIACMAVGDDGLAPVPVPEQLRRALEPYRIH